MWVIVTHQVPGAAIWKGATEIAINYGMHSFRKSRQVATLWNSLPRGQQTF